nr:hypothetical protein [uncultured bacterium]
MSLPQKQRGIALPITMLLLFVMTLVGVSSLRTTLLEQDMTANTRLRLVAFNAAETALREAENHMVEINKNQTVADVRTLFFTGLRPDGTTQPGDSCTNGYCTPLQHDNSGSSSTDERWDDATLNVWNTSGKYRSYTNYTASGIANEGVYAAPKYIVEFMGNFAERNQGKFQTNCLTDPATGKVLAPNDAWPFCAADPATYRVTVRATAGPVSRQAVVMLQSTVRIP